MERRGQGERSPPILSKPAPEHHREAAAGAGTLWGSGHDSSYWSRGALLWASGCKAEAFELAAQGPLGPKSRLAWTFSTQSRVCRRHRVGCVDWQKPQDVKPGGLWEAGGTVLQEQGG